MASNKTRTRTIRIANETADYFEKLPLNRIVECVHALMESGLLKFDGEEVILSGNSGVHTEDKYNLPDEAMKDIEGMANFCGVTLYDTMLEVDRLLNEGTLMIGDEIKVVMPSWVTKIEEVCHDRCVSVDAFGKKVLDMIERGQI